MKITSLLSLALGCGLAASALLTAADAAPRKARPASPPAEAPAYLRDVISVTSNGRHGTPASATCVVWANAEGLGVGPDQLNGFHGVSFNINPKPLPGEVDSKASTTTDGLKAVRAQTPPPPAWMTAAIEKNAGKIDAACSQEQVEPLVITKLTAKDKAG